MFTGALIDVFFEDVPGVDDGLNVIFEQHLPRGILGGVLPQLLCDLSIELRVASVELGQLVHRAVYLVFVELRLFVVFDFVKLGEDPCEQGHDIRRK